MPRRRVLALVIVVLTLAPLRAATMTAAWRGQLIFTSDRKERREARRLLALGVERIVRQRDESGRLWAEMRGNLAGILQLDDEVLAGFGAGRGILSLPPQPRAARVIA